MFILQGKMIEKLEGSVSMYMDGVGGGFDGSDIWKEGR